MKIYNLISFAGVFILMTFAWVCSRNRRNVNFRVVGWGLALMLAFAAFIFLVPAGSRLFLALNGVVIRILGCANDGSYFLFGRFALPPGAERDGQGSLGFVLAFQALPTIIFFSALMALLYWAGIMARVVSAFAWVFTRLMRVSGAESLATASNIFVGIEANFTIRPFLERMTESELCTVLTAGMATIASSVMAFYVYILQEQFGTIAGHLMSASVISAPAALVMSKLLCPEDGKPETLGVVIKEATVREESAILAVINGANAGVRLCVGIVALLLAVIGLVALANVGLSYAGALSQHVIGRGASLNLEGILAFVAWPFTVILGVPPADVPAVARLIGERVILTEVKSYQDLATLMANGALTHPRSALIASYALCGFAHIPSLAIFVGGTAALVPGRARDLSRIGPRALLAATLACLMTGAVAGVFASNESLLLK